MGTKRKSTAMPCFAWVNTVLSNVKTAITGSADGGATITLTTRPGSMTVKTSGGATVTGG